MSFSQNVKKFRLARDLTQEQLAGMLGVSAQAVSKWETSETYPDGALLAPLAEALEVSLDTLFDRDFDSMPDFTSRLYAKMKRTDRAEQMRAIRTVGWQMEKALFNSYMEIEPTYDPAELVDGGHSYILSDHGFTLASNATASPYFAVFEEPENGFAEAIGDGSLIRKVFEALASPDTMRALIYVHQKEPQYVMEAALIGRDCEIAPDKLDGVIEDLCYLRVLRRRKLVIDGAEFTLYATAPCHYLMAIFLLAREIRWFGSFTKQAHHRQKPFLR